MLRWFKFHNTDLNSKLATVALDIKQCLVGPAWQNLRLASANCPLATDAPLTLGGPRSPRCLVLAFPWLCGGSWWRENWGAQQAVGSRSLPRGRFGLASGLGLEPWQCSHDNCSHSEAGNDELLDFMTQ